MRANVPTGAAESVAIYVITESYKVAKKRRTLLGSSVHEDELRLKLFLRVIPLFSLVLVVLLPVIPI